MDNVILKAEGINKSFGSNRVLTDISVDIFRGEVHAIVGENGAGKSTFIKALSGEYSVDAGKFYLDGKDITGHSVKSICDSGLSVIHQNLNLVPSLSIEQNILSGDVPTNKVGFLRWKDKRDRAIEVLRMVSDKLSPDTTVAELSAAEKQLVVIARAIVNTPKLLVLDEPTARLGLEETDLLFKLIGKLKEQNVTMLYITHRMEEIFRICDRVSIFRNGVRVMTKPVSETDQDEIVREMLGKTVGSFKSSFVPKIGDTVLEVKDLKYKNMLKGISFNVKAGEIVGLVGSVGAGKSETLEVIYGTLKPDAGEVSMFGEAIPTKKLSPRLSISKEVALVPEDRRVQGVVEDFVNRENLTFVNIEKVSKKFFLKSKLESQAADDMMKNLHVKPDDAEYTTGLLSGGNMQKIALGRWMMKNYRLYLMDEITSGVDVGAKAEIYKMITDLANEGSAVLLSTSDMMEAMALCNRFVVLHRGKVVAEIAREDATVEKLLLAMMGGKQNEVANS